MWLVSEQRGGGPVSDFVPPSDWADATRVFNEHRDLLIGVAYRVLGRVSDAEDVVQDAWLRWVNARPSEVANPRAFLVRVTTRSRSTSYVVSRLATSPMPALGYLSRCSPTTTSRRTPN